MLSRWNRVFCPAATVDKTWSLLNVGSLVSLMICTVMTIVASRNTRLATSTNCLCFALRLAAFATFMPNEYITHLEATRGMMVHIGLSLSLTRHDNRRAVCATTGVDRLSVEEQKAGV